MQQLLLACVRDHDWTAPPAEAEALLPVVDQQALLDAASLHRVTGCVAGSLAGLGGVRPRVTAELAAARYAALAMHLRVGADLRLLRAALGDAVPWLVVKGPVLAEHYYRRPELRGYGDLDVLVPPQSLGAALRLLEDEGFTTLDRNWTMLLQRLPGELHLLTPHGTMLDLHWDLHNAAAVRRSFTVRTDALFARARCLTVAGVPVHTLDPADTLVHTALHAARSGGDRLVWMKDLEQVVLRRELSWDELADRCAEHRAQLPVALMLERSQRTLDVADLPARALQRLGAPRAWRALGRAVDGASPVVRAAGDGSAGRLYARSLRGDSRQTTVELVRRSGARLRRQLRPIEPAPLWDPTAPGSALFPSGGEAGRAAFLAAVAKL